MNKVPAVLSISFRPFFILAASLAVLNPLLWILNYLGHFFLPLNNVNALFWHGHEMIFGFSGALIAGFILTASANWTGSAPYQGRSLLFLAFIWIGERLYYFLPLDRSMHFVLMNLFFPILTLMLLAKLMKFPKQKYVFIPILIGLMVGKLLHSWGHLYGNLDLEIAGKHLATGLIRFIILLIAGRVIPFFSRSKIEGLIIEFPGWINLISLIPILLLAIPWPTSTPKTMVVLVYAVAIFGNILRQLLWKPLKTIKVPILFVLHLGVGLINLGLIQELMALFYGQFNFSQASLHMLMAAGLGVISIGIMSRVALGHTGRGIKADKAMILAYSLVFIGGLMRAGIPVFMPHFYLFSLSFSGILWSLGFLIFLIKFWKILVEPRPDNKPY